MIKKTLSLCMATAVMAGCVSNTSEMDKKEIISKLSIEDKAHFVIGTGMEGFDGNSAVIGATKKLVPGAAGTTYPLDSLNIPSIVLADGPAGLRKIGRASCRERV